MRTMIDLGNHRGGGPLYINIIDTPTSVDCTKDVRFRRSFRSLVECMVPCCGFQPSESEVSEDETDFSSSPSSSAAAATTTHAHGSTVTGTFFGYRKGRVSFCLQDDSRGSPLLLLEFAVPTSYLAREMQHGLLRIALECDRTRTRPSPSSLFSVPVWCMYCNGRKVGFAVRRQMTKTDTEVLKLMQSVSVGAGVLPRNSTSISTSKIDHDGDLMYLRANFERVTGSPDSESFHMINPVGCYGQQLSIFFLRS